MHHRLPYVLVPVMVLSALLALAGLYSGSLILWLGAVAAIFLFVACAIVLALVLVVGNAMQARRRATRGHLYTPVTAEVQHVYRRSASRSRGSWTFWVSYTFGGKNIRNSLTILDREFAERAQATGRVYIKIDPDYPREIIVTAEIDLDGYNAFSDGGQVSPAPIDPRHHMQIASGLYTQPTRPG